MDRDRRRDALDVAEGCLDLDALLVVVGAVIVGVLLWFVLIPVLIFIGELTLLLALVVGAAIGRVLFRRPWVIEAVGPSGEVRHWEVVGWRASGRHLDLVVEQLRSGLPMPEGAA